MKSTEHSSLVGKVW